MKPIVRTLIVFLIIGALGTPAAAQQTSNHIVTRRQAATIEHRDAAGGSFPELKRGSASSNHLTDSGKDSKATPKVSGSLVTICSSLAVVLGLFAGFVWINRKFGSGSGNNGGIPKEVVQPLGSTPIDSRNRVTMLRCGNRILVLVQNAQGVQPVAEITSADEVRELTAACLGNSKQAFASTLQSIEQERTDAGFLGEQPRQQSTRTSGRLFASA
jgi:flagellar biogenesis protein FliO